MDPERIGHLIAKFREDHPDADAGMLLEFSQHVRRVLIDELREEVKAGNVPVKLSMQINGASFSAQGPRSYVEALLENWSDRHDVARKNITPGFNRMKLMSGPTR